MADRDEIRASAVHNLIFTKEKVSLEEFEYGLPSLPLPPLKKTLQKYLRSVKPFLSDDKFAATERIVNDFKSGVGMQLQDILEHRAKQKKNWLEEYWHKYAYLSTRGPLIPTSNVACNHPLNLNLFPPIEANAMKYGAIGIWIVSEFYKNIKRGLLRPHFSLSGEKLSMSQFISCFNMCRVPKEQSDELISTFKSKALPSTYVVILCNGYIWMLDPWDVDGEQLQVNEIEKQLKFIKDESHALPAGPEVAVLTLDNREAWAVNRRRLMSLSEQNAANLNIIESSIFHMCLEDTRPNSVEEAYSNALCGLSANRWADKALSFVVFANGYLASHSEHSPADAMVNVVLGHYTIDVITNVIGDVWRKEEVLSRNITYPKMLKFDLDDKLTKSVQAVKEYNFNLQRQVDARYYIFNHFGKDWIKSMKIHPDTFVQAALQLTYYTIHKKLAPTYETATTRKFYHGRTETVRSCTLEMADWLESMTSPVATATEKTSKLLKAMKVHLEMMRECQNGHGIDRHMMGLYIVALENGFELPHIFVDPAYVNSGGGGNFVLSTSTVGSGHAVGGIVPMMKNGYSVMYSFLPERLNFTITCYLHSGTCSNGFISTLENSLILLKDLLGMPASNL